MVSFLYWFGFAWWGDEVSSIPFHVVPRCSSAATHEYASACRSITMARYMRPGKRHERKREKQTIRQRKGRVIVKECGNVGMKKEQRGILV